MPGPNKKQRGLVVWKNYRTGNFLAGHSIGHPVMNSRQSERSVPWTTRCRVEINISFHGSLFINGLWQRYISSSAWFFLLASHNAAAGQRRVFALPCVHPRAGRQCIALTKRKAYRASLLWAKRIAVWSNLTITKAVRSRTKLKINNSSRVSTSTPMSPMLLTGLHSSIANILT